MVALELTRSKIRVNAICPGSIKTATEESTRPRKLSKLGPRAKSPDGRIPLTGENPGTAGQVADLMLFLAGDESSHVTGSVVFGAQSLLRQQTPLAVAPATGLRNSKDRTLS